MYAQNLLQRQLQIQQLYAAQAQANLLRIPPPALRAPNARIIVTPTAGRTQQPNQQLMLQQMQAAQANLAAAQQKQQQQQAQATTAQQSQNQQKSGSNTNTTTTKPK
eukprot:CAMPEP_0201586164 /NCGR_PEP_ID=MMETSP0190_2-20130828/129749_1 /ASSEMBLY_ACC=CAM_ASM_000263 /TAXON_ID=37353 /ORGANISM="Rosalina sp." /LENGTH=106 /DNA_ID=CAMNT_0048033583 /DNA_START=27 /DNA_END=344 /DNA_ORIENTATION=-